MDEIRTRENTRARVLFLENRIEAHGITNFNQFRGEHNPRTERNESSGTRTDDRRRAMNVGPPHYEFILSRMPYKQNPKCVRYISNRRTVGQNVFKWDKIISHLICSCNGYYKKYIKCY
jgi:hypothetical protein